ncbi:hypothetical protein [Streptomyces benahoarensis]|uniref:Uncharacterized protein n=1 Tax=Streptomyces benahoarensis TaxID=2595054 RepID=A0A553ZRY1_9ACTN|nr:hypothetical protein [Streptomyces benahoarensis]TSB32674.1 hypothetical protein FNJ62_01025 [Streptomyces benahoarensis]TSB44230.1 hypothetical protein FNZ23_00320 [Streptomyces benahoarensis]
MVATPPLSPQGTPLGLLKELAAALDGLGPVVDTALGDLTVGETELALNALGPKDRQATMQGLGFRKVEPRRFGRVLSEQVLKRVQRVESADRRHAVSHLTAQITKDLARVAGERGPARTGPGLVDRWGTRLLRLALFSHVQASAYDARLLVWAAGHDWFGIDADETARGAAFTAAWRVIDETPGFDQPTAPHEDAVADGPQPMTAIPAPRRPDHTEPPKPAGPTTEHGQRPRGERNSMEELTAAEEELPRIVEEARGAADRLRSSLLDGCPPAPTDLTPLAAVAPAFSRARAALSAVGVTGVADRLTDILTAIDELRTRAERNERNTETRRLVATVTALGCSPDSALATVVVDAGQRAKALLAKQEWDEQDDACAHFLALLARLVDMKGRLDAQQEIIGLQQQLSVAHPPYAVAAVLYEQLTVTEDTTADDAAAPQSADSAESRETPDHTDAPEAATAPHGDTGVAVAQDQQDHSTTDSGPDERGSRFSDIAEQQPAPPRPVIADPAVTTATTDGTRPKDIEPVLARLIAEKRFGLAAHLSQTADRPDTESAALRLAAAATLLRSRAGRAAQVIEESLHEWEARKESDTDALSLLVLPTLVRAALMTGAPVAGAQLRALAPQLPAALHEVATTVAERALQGALLIAPHRAVVADVSHTESELREAVDACQALLTAPRLRFQRASAMVQRWLAPTGLLGSVLTAIVAGAPDAATRADELLENLARRTQIEAALDEMDAALRGPGGRSLQGSGRNNVRHCLERGRDAVRQWRAVKRGLEAGRAEENVWAFQSVASLRLSLLGLRERVADDLAAAERSSAVLAKAAACVARDLFAEVFDGLDADSRPVETGPEPDVQQALDAELYKARPTAPGEELTVDGLLEAVDRTWDDAIEHQLAGDEYGVVRSIMDLADLDVLPAAHTLTLSEERRAQLTVRERERRAALAEKQRQLAVRLRRSQADEALTVEQDVSLQELLADARAHLEHDGPDELAAVRRNLDRVEVLLPRYRKEAADQLRARLAALTDVSAEDRERVQRNLDTDSLATAAELVYFLELGEPVPEIRSEDSHLEAFFPAVPDALPGGIDAELVAAVRTRGRYGDETVLDYAGLSEEEAERAAAALELWNTLAVTKDRIKINPRESLTPALSLLGYEARRARPVDDLPRGKDYRFFELAEVHVTGRAWAPSFGSQIKDRGGKLRALLIWGRPAAKLLISRALQDPDESSLLVVHFGTLDSRTRIELAAASQGTKPIMVIDDTALAYLVAHGNRRVDATTETLLPFSAVNPYIKEKRGQIGREMFYGRDRERKSIHDPAGTQILYGGRGLGKSALLADAGDRFEEQRPGAYRKLYLNLDKIGIGRSTAIGAEAIWPTLDQELIRQGVLEEPRRRDPQQESWQRVTNGIARWLDQDPDRRLLILLDECDRFFEADVPECTETRRLRGLGEDSRGRAKVVFAGLHSVQRFTRLARNGPFSHLAQTPTVVGPLTPQFAADLIVHPMRALGFEFADVDLVNRVLGFCSYQPFLLQIFGSRMVQVMQGKRARTLLGPPPYTIEESDVDEVEQDASLRSDITAAFKDTLALDDRYHVIANVLAQHARDNGLETRLSDRELREECAGWWPRGFEQLDSEGFRAYLQEMVGLGALAPNNDGQGWHLRGPNALRMIGTAQEIEARLLRAEKESRLEETVVLESRPDLLDSRSAPLTVNQIDYLLGECVNQVRVVLGTQATGVADVEMTLRAVTGKVAGWSVPPIGSAKTFRRELAAGRAGERRLLISDLSLGSEKSCRDSLGLARAVLPEAAEATRSVVLVSGATQLGFWPDLLTGPDADHDAVVVLRRYDLRSLKDWTQRYSLCETEERLARLAAVTGGWPYLLDKALKLRERRPNQDRLLDDLTSWLEQSSGAEEFVEAVGLLESDPLKAAYDGIVEQLGADWHDDGYLVTAAEMAGLSFDEALGAVTCLETLQAFDRDGTRLRVEPVLHAALGVLDGKA